MDDLPTTSFVRVGRLEELKARGRLIVRGPHRPILVVYDHGRIFALDNRCPHMGFPLERGSVEDGILTCHWHHARFDLASGCTFDLWADDVPSCPVEVRGSEIWVQPTFGHADPAAHWRRRLDDGLAHDLGNFDDFPVIRIDEAPLVTNVHIIPADPDTPPSGVGEPGVPPFAPALINAIFAATGKRIRALPIGKQLEA